MGTNKMSYHVMVLHKFRADFQFAAFDWKEIQVITK